MLKSMSEIESATAQPNQPQSCDIAAKTCGCCSCGTSAAQPVTLETVPESSANRAVYRIENMDCPTEEALIRKKLGGIPGIDGLEFNLMQRVLTVHHSLDSLDGVEKALASIDMQAEPVRGGMDGASLFSITGMDCPTEEALIRGKLASIKGITGLDFNRVQRTLKVEHEPAALPAISAALQSLDMGAIRVDTESSAPAPTSTPVHWTRLSIAAAAALDSEVAELASANSRIFLALALVAILVGGL